MYDFDIMDIIYRALSNKVPIVVLAVVAMIVLTALLLVMLVSIFEKEVD